MASPYLLLADGLVVARGLGPSRFPPARQTNCWKHRSKGHADSQSHGAYNQWPFVNHGFQGPLVGQAQVAGSLWQCAARLASPGIGITERSLTTGNETRR